MSEATLDLPGFDFSGRRQRFLESIGDGVAILRAPPMARHANDVEHPYRPNSDFFYLTGFPESEAVAVFDGNADKEKFLLFVLPRDPDQETWTGPRAGCEGAVEDFGADAAYPLSELDQHLAPLIGRAQLLHYGLGLDPVFDQRLLHLAERSWARRPRSAAGQPASIIDPRPTIHELRLFKSEAELAWMRRTIEIATSAHREAQAQVRPGMWEYEIEALLDFVFRRRGASGWAYPSIVAGGKNATVLHYIANKDQLQEGDLLLIDAGSELGLYCADVTRTFPVGTTFSAEQQRAYDIVLAAQKAAIETVRPGKTVEDVHHAALEILTDGLLSIGLIDGSVDQAISESLYQPWYMHRTSHWLGMDVHDVGAYERDKKPRPLEPGMVLTVEPGLYFPTANENTPEAYRGIGIRIEDDILVTEDGSENLSSAAPKEPDEMLALRE